MLKFVYCVRRRADISPADFRTYWLERHGPLVKQFAGVLRAIRYVQSHTLQTELNEAARVPRRTAEPYDGITELWWSSPEDLVAALQTPEGREANRALAEDEARFVDLSRSTVFFTEEHTIFDE